MKKRTKRIVRWSLGIVLAPLLLVVIAMVLIYLPPIQRFAKDKATAAAAGALGLDVSIDRVALRFPLSLVVRDVYVSDDVDTVMFVREFVVDIPLRPLFGLRVDANTIELHDAQVKTKNIIPGYVVAGNIDRLRLESHGVDLRDSRITVNELALSDTDVALCITDTTAADTTASEPFEWTIDVRRVDIDDVHFSLSMPLDTMSMSAGLAHASIADCVADLGAGTYSLGHFGLEDAMFGINTGGQETPGVFNPSDIMASGININIDSVLYAGRHIAAKISSLSASEKCGVRIVSGGGRVWSDDESVYVRELGLRTAASSLEINASAGWGLTDSLPDGAVDIDVAASISPSDIEHLTGPLHGQIPRQPVNLSLAVAGTPERLDLSHLNVRWDGVADLHLYGQLDAALDSVRRAAKVNLSLHTGNLDFVKPVMGLADSAFFIPAGLGIESQAAYADGKCNASLQIDRAGLSLDGSYSPADESYALTMSIDSLVVSDFIALDGLAPVDLTLKAAGAGFDPFDLDTRMRLKMDIGHLCYGDYDLSNTLLAARLRHGRGRVAMTTANGWTDLSADIRAALSGHHSTMDFGLDVRRLDITSLMSADTTTTASVNASLSLATDMGEMFDVSGRIGDTRLVIGGNEARPKDINFTAYTDAGETRASVSAGDLSLNVRGDSGVTRLAEMLQAFTGKLGEQLTEHKLDYSKLRDYLPDLYMELRADADNPMSNYLKLMGVGIAQTRIRVSTNSRRGLAGDIALRTIGVDSIRLDSAYMWFVQDSTSIRYKLNVANSQTMANYASNLALKGEITNRSADMLVDMTDQAGEKGVYLGCKAEFVRQGVKVSFFPDAPVFLFRDFHLNDSNYILFANDKKIYADVSFKDDKGMGLSLTSSKTKRGNDRLTAALAGIDIADIRTLIPMLPDMAGVISADVSYTPLRRTYSLSCNAEIEGFEYEKREVADFSLKASYVPIGEIKQVMSAKLGINGREALSVGGKIEADSNTIAYRMRLDSLPLGVANAFMPEDLATLDGSMSGELQLGGSFAKPILNGSVRFNQTSAYIVQAGTRIRLDERPLVVKDSRLEFDRFALLTRTDNPFTIDGDVDFSDLSSIKTDLQFMASDYELLNAKKTKASLVYGKVYFDSAISVKGELDDLQVRGYLKLLGNTNVTYILKESSLTVQDRLGETITFTDFSDTTHVEGLDIHPIPISGMDVLLNISIDPTAAVNIDLSESGDNRIEVAGGGDLSMQYTAQGDLSLSGRYTFSGGNISYSLPLVKIADFSVRNGGYIEWTGNAFNPTMNLTAVKKVRTDVANSDGEGTRKVDFEVSVNIYNSLDDLGLSFDLSAPQDADVQNTLAATGEDERRTMALTMMVTGMYTGGGTTGDMNLNMGTALNSLLQKEISSAAGKIKAVDLSLGMENPNGEEGLDNMDISYKISKRFLNDRFNIVIGGTISTGSNAAESNKESFIDNISVEYRLDNSGTRYVKVFHNKNYESVLEGEITETGAGIVLRKKMLRLKELFTFKRKKAITQANDETNDR